MRGIFFRLSVDFRLFVARPLILVEGGAEDPLCCLWHCQVRRRRRMVIRCAAAASSSTVSALNINVRAQMKELTMEVGR